MKNILLAWIGRNDLDSPAKRSEADIGAIAQGVGFQEWDEVLLLSDWPPAEYEPYVDWLKRRTKAMVRVRREKLSSPMNFNEIYPAAVRAVQDVHQRFGREAQLTFHLSPGTQHMGSVWIILSKTRFPARLIQSAREKGVEVVSVPFDISADFLPDLLARPDSDLEALCAGLPPQDPRFDDLVHRSRSMARVVAMARRVAVRGVTVLIEGESGTGKELLARAIHSGSPRHQKPFIAVNCGAIAPDVVESELFGHRKGAFTGATQDRKGHFEEAHGGTLLLDEVGELSPRAQVELLRALQEGEVVPVGASKPVKVDVRVIAATNRNLLTEVGEGRFRSDLYYRLAVAVIRIPPLRERPEDLMPLVDTLLEKVNREGEGSPGFQRKTLTAGGRNAIKGHVWPGNVRELENTLRRAVLWCPEPALRAEDLRESILAASSPPTDGILNRPLGDDLDVSELLSSVARHYLDRAMKEAAGNKTRAAELLGLPSYQTLTNWLKKYGVD